MEMKEIRRKKAKAEAEITVVMDEIMRRFQSETGFSISSISINMVDVAEVQEKEKRYIVFGCDVGVEI